MVNKAKALHSNQTPEEMIGKTDYDFLPEEEAKKSFDDENQILQTGQPIINKVEKITHTDGTERWVSVTKVPRFSPEGDIIGTVGISRDITEQEQAKKELLVSKERYQYIFENSSFAIVLTDENHLIVQWNKLAKQLLNMDDSDLHLKPIKTLYPPEEWKKIQTRYDKEVTGKNRLETKILRKDNERIDVDLSVNLIKDSSGYILGSTEIIHDISARKQTEQALDQHHELIQTLMDNIPDSIYFKDNENKFILVNKAKADHWDLKPEDMIGKTDYDFLDKETAEQAFKDDNQILQTGKPILDKIEKITGSDGLTRWFSVTKVPRYNKKGDIIGTMGISRNVTEWKKHEQMKKENLK